MILAMVSRDVKPNISSTFSSVMWSPQNATSWSSMDCASRIPPSAPLAMAHAASWSRVTPSLFEMKVSWSAMVLVSMGLRSNL